MAFLQSVILNKMKPANSAIEHMLCRNFNSLKGMQSFQVNEWSAGFLSVKNHFF